MNAIFKLIRLQNLIFVVLIQTMIHFFVLNPILVVHGITPSTPLLALIILIISTVLVAAGGYIINDYFDQKIDAINKPTKKIVGKFINQEKTMLLHQTLSVAGVIGGLYSSWLARSYVLAFIFILVPGLLWFYSVSYKKKFLIGNLTIAFLSALTVLIIGIFDLSFLKLRYEAYLFESRIPAMIYFWTLGFAFFAFITTWIREIIKDMEDFAGDKKMNCRTMPIVWGFNKTKYITSALILVCIGALIFLDRVIIQFNTDISNIYIQVLLIIPLIYLQFRLFRSVTPKQYHDTATLVKIIMLIGLCYSVVFGFSVADKYNIEILQFFK